ncbi:hypothetical protein [Emticicia sp. W12TSBA100-4]|uniref:hypothetical protein n=1 Tax=Emticicia sp. W12TSBA100-4 TaxID=3160965 RepID=UPI003305D4F1
MKTIKTFLVIFFFSSKLMAQFIVIQPETFQLATITNYPCPASDIGKIFYNTNDNNAVYCKGTFSTESAKEFWNLNGNTINYTGKVGIRTGTPSYDLDISGNGKLKSTNFIAQKLGIGTSTPTESVELKDREIAFSSTADAVSYRFRYIDAADKFEFVEAGTGKIQVANGGNVSIGGSPSSDKLNVIGNVNFNGNLTIEGKGTVYNSTAPQLKLVISSVTTPSTFFIANNACSTTGFTFPAASFSSAPAVAVGQKTASGGGTDEGIVITVEGVTASGGTVRFCNHTGGGTSVNSTTYSLISIGNSF